VGCDICHVQTLATASAGTKINGGTFSIPAGAREKQFHPYGDFLLHRCRVPATLSSVAMLEHYGKNMSRNQLEKPLHP